MIGRRLPVIDGHATMPTLPGDYCGPVVEFTDALPSVLFLKPNARDPDAPRRARSIQHVCSPPHRFRECADGSLEIRESISNLTTRGEGDDGWHGYLDEGHSWRKV